MSKGPTINEKYTRGSDVLNFIVYERTNGAGSDEVLQHKLFGTTETAHITLHPDGTVHFRVEKSGKPLENAVRTELMGFYPNPSDRLREFLAKIRGKI